MINVTVIGTGSMGTAIAGIAAIAGARLQVVARDKEKARALCARLNAELGSFEDELTGDIVVLAVPAQAIDGIVKHYGDALNGKVLVDITNPINETSDALIVDLGTSAAAKLAAAVPAAHVVKAFNVNFASTLVSTVVGPVRTTVLVAADDPAAKAAVRNLVEAAGLISRDAGTLIRARELEAMAFLQITLGKRKQIPWTGGFAVVA